MKYFLRSILVLVCVFAITGSVFAENIRYGGIIAFNTESIIIREGGLEKNDRYLCSVTSGDCGKINSTSTEAVAPTYIKKGASYAYSFNKKSLVSSYQGDTVGNITYQVIETYDVDTKSVLHTDFVKTKVSRMVVSDTGRTIAYLDGSNTLSIVDHTTGLLQTQSFDKNQMTVFAISPDGRYVSYFKQSLMDSHERIYGIIDLNTQKKYETKSDVYWDLLGEENRIFAFSPDSTKLVYMDDKNGFPSLYQVNLAALTGNTFSGKQLITKKYTVRDFLFADNNSLLVLANREQTYIDNLYKLTLSPLVITKLVDDISYTGPVEKIGNSIVFYKKNRNGIMPALFNTNTHMVTDFKTEGFNKDIVSTYPNTILEEQVNVGGVTGVLVKSTAPTTQTTRPLIVWLHGGPYRQTNMEFHPYRSYGVYDWMLREAADQGAVVLKLDYTGSYGYGKSFAENLRGNVGKAEVQQVLAATNAIAQKEKISDIYLVGNSYGGYLSLRTIVEKPEKFKGAYSISGVTDWKTLLTNVPSSFFALHFNGAPDEKNKKLYDQASVVDRIKNLSTQKIVLVHGQSDTSVSPSQSLIMNQALVAEGKNVTYIPIEGENHVYAKDSSMNTICNALFDMISFDKANSCKFGE